jgi:signal transduction histidine kinase
MSNFKFTGVNIAAALLIIAFFFPWFSAMGSVSMSGFSIASTGISPGMLSMFLKGMDRILMILIVIVPLSGALILYQNVTGNKKFDKYYKPAHLVPALVLIAGMIMIYFKIKPDMPDAANDSFGGYESMRHISRSMREMTPGLFDVLALGVYISLAAAVYLLLVNIGKIKDKEYYKPTVQTTVAQNNTNQGSDNNPVA